MSAFTYAQLSLPLIQKAEELGYASDNCAYVKADIGLFHSGYVTPFATIPKPDVLVCNYVGCNVYLNWFEHLAEMVDAPAMNIDIPFIRSADNEPSEADLTYVVKQLEELIVLLEQVSGKSLDWAKLTTIVERSARTRRSASSRSSVSPVSSTTRSTARPSTSRASRTSTSSSKRRHGSTRRSGRRSRR